MITVTQSGTIIGSDMSSYAGYKSITVTPSGTSVLLNVESSVGYINAPNGGMFGIAALTSDRTDYVPENVTVQTCTKQDDKYEFGFNGQMKVNEVAGVGNWGRVSNVLVVLVCKYNKL